MASYVRYDDPRVEPAVQDEGAKIELVTGLVNAMQEKNFGHHRRGYRGTHVKTQGIVKGSLEVLPNLPAHLAQGLFSNESKTYPVAMRFANEPTFLQDDRAPGPRGVGMKVFEVEGKFLDPVGERTHTQDFTFNNAPILELRDVTNTAQILDIRLRNFDDQKGLEKELGQREDRDLQFAPAQLPNQHFLSYTMYSQSAYRYGQYVCKYALFPAAKLQRDLEKVKVTDESDREQHSKWLQDYFSNNSAEYEFRVQLLQDPAKQDVEDTSKEWDESHFPFVTVGKLRIPAGQDCFSPERRTFWEDKVKLNVWYGLEAHRPLGSVNRLRKEVYQASVAKREKMNATAVEEIASVDQLP